jgi:nucleotide-binding universal stress UspA family protein
MLPFRRILVPIDYSDPCRAVMPYVAQTARHFRAELTLVHALGPGSLAVSDLMLSDPNLTEEVQAIQQARLADFAGETFPGLRVETLTAVGEPGAVIRDTIHKQGADLIMMATHGHGPMRRMLLGSITAKVLHDVTTPVWTAVGQHTNGRTPAMPYRSILCAIDHTAESEGVLRAGAALAVSYGASLSLVNVVEMPPATWEIDIAGLRENLVEASRVQLREMEASLSAQIGAVHLSHNVLEDAVSHGICREAERVKADLIIAGRGHAQAAFGRIWSNLYQIVREAPCPVLSL